MTTHLEIRFVSSNPLKIEEAREILEPKNISVLGSNVKINELQTKDTRALVQDKLLKAYAQIGRPLFVEHTGLYLEHLEGLPGGLTQIFWDTLKADKFSALFGKDVPVNVAAARTTIAYCDGKALFEFDGEITGIITPEPRGPRDFQWDCVFQPNGYKQTFAEMGEAMKNSISMRRRALDRFSDFLGGVK